MTAQKDYGGDSPNISIDIGIGVNRKKNNESILTVLYSSEETNAIIVKEVIGGRIYFSKRGGGCGRTRGVLYATDHKKKTEEVYDSGRPASSGVFRLCDNLAVYGCVNNSILFDEYPCLHGDTNASLWGHDFDYYRKARNREPALLSSIPIKSICHLTLKHTFRPDDITKCIINRLYSCPVYGKQMDVVTTNISALMTRLSVEGGNMDDIPIIIFDIIKKCYILAYVTNARRMIILRSFKYGGLESSQINGTHGEATNEDDLASKTSKFINNISVTIVPDSQVFPLPNSGSSSTMKRISANITASTEASSANSSVNVLWWIDNISSNTPVAPPEVLGTFSNDKVISGILNIPTSTLADRTLIQQTLLNQMIDPVNSTFQNAAFLHIIYGVFAGTTTLNMTFSFWIASQDIMSITNDVPVNVVNNPNVNISNTPSVNVTNIPSVNVNNNPSVVISNTPNVGVVNTVNTIVVDVNAPTQTTPMRVSSTSTPLDVVVKDFNISTQTSVPNVSVSSLLPLSSVITDINIGNQTSVLMVNTGTGQKEVNKDDKLDMKRDDRVEKIIEEAEKALLSIASNYIRQVKEKLVGSYNTYGNEQMSISIMNDLANKMQNGHIKDIIQTQIRDEKAKLDEYEIETKIMTIEEIGMWFNIYELLDKPPVNTKWSEDDEVCAATPSNNQNGRFKAKEKNPNPIDNKEKEQRRKNYDAMVERLQLKIKKEEDVIHVISSRLKDNMNNAHKRLALRLTENRSLFDAIKTVECTNDWLSLAGAFMLSAHEGKTHYNELKEKYDEFVSLNKTKKYCINSDIYADEGSIIILLKRKVFMEGSFNPYGNGQNDVLNDDVLSDVIPDVPVFDEEKAVIYGLNGIEILTNIADMEMWLINHLYNEKEIDYPNRELADSHIMNVFSQEPNNDILSRLVTYAANIPFNKEWSNYIGPGYMGGEFKPVETINQLATRLAVPPNSELDEIARFHDLLRSVTINKDKILESDEKMVKAIENMNNKTLQSDLASRALQYVINNTKTDDKLPIEVLNEINSIANTDEIETFNNERLIDDQKIYNRINKQLDTIHKFAGTVNKPRMEGSFNPYGNGQPIDVVKMLKALIEYIAKWRQLKTDIPSLWGHTIPITSKKNNSFDVSTYITSVLFPFASKISLTLINLDYQSEMPLDGYTCLPRTIKIGVITNALIAVDLGIAWERSSMAGPALVGSSITKNFAITTEAELKQSLAILRVNTAPVQGTTNFLIWYQIRQYLNDYVEESSSGKSSYNPNNKESSLNPIIGSNAWILAQTWLYADRMNATSEMSPVHNKLDSTYATPTDTLGVSTLYAGGRNVVAWAMNINDYIGYSYTSFVPVVGTFTEPIFIFVTSDQLVQTSKIKNGIQVETYLPVGSRTSNIKQLSVNNPLGNSITQIQSSLDNSGYTSTGGDINVCFVLTDFNATVSGNNFATTFSIPVGNDILSVNINSRNGANNPMFLGGTGVILNASLDAIYLQLQGANTNGIIDQVAYMWMRMYGNEDEIQRAVIIYALLKWRFAIGCVWPVENDAGANPNLQYGSSTRVVTPMENINPEQVYNTGSMNHIFTMTDMFGTSPLGDATSQYYISVMQHTVRVGLATHCADFVSSKCISVPNYSAVKMMMATHGIATIMRKALDIQLGEAGLTMDAYIGSPNFNGINSDRYQETQALFIDAAMNMFGLGIFIRRFTTPFPQPVNLLPVYDAWNFAIIPFNIERSHANRDWYISPPVEDVRKFDEITDDSQSMQYSNQSLIMEGDMPFGNTNVYYREKPSNSEMIDKNFIPSINTLGLYRLNDTIIGTFVFGMREHNRNQLFVPFQNILLPSATKYFQILSAISNDNTVVVPFTPIVNAMTEPTTFPKCFVNNNQEIHSYYMDANLLQALQTDGLKIWQSYKMAPKPMGPSNVSNVKVASRADKAMAKLASTAVPSVGVGSSGVTKQEAAVLGDEI